MRSVTSLFQECAAALQFPYYFGGNWDALDECITDMAWLPAAGYLLGVTDADLILSDETEEDIKIFLQTLVSAAEFWASEPNSQYQEIRQRFRTSLHVLLHVRPEKAESFRSSLSGFSTSVDSINGEDSHDH